MDGGIADNLAMRFMIETALAYGDDAERFAPPASIASVEYFDQRRRRIQPRFLMAAAKAI